MNELKNKIIEALNDESETLYGRGSCGELGDSVDAIISDYFSYIADKILDIEELKQLQNFKDSSIGLWAFDCNPKDLLHKLNASQSDAHCMVLEDFEQLLKDWERFCNNENYFKSPFFQL